MTFPEKKLLAILALVMGNIINRETFSKNILFHENMINESRFLRNFDLPYSVQIAKLNNFGSNFGRYSIFYKYFRLFDTFRTLLAIFLENFILFLVDF